MTQLQLLEQIIKTQEQLIMAQQDMIASLKGLQALDAGNFRMTPVETPKTTTRIKEILATYELHGTDEAAAFKGIPIQYLDEVKQDLKRRFPSWSFRYRFRGPRRHMDRRSPLAQKYDCTKAAATTFAVYAKSKASAWVK